MDKKKSDDVNKKSYENIHVDLFDCDSFFALTKLYFDEDTTKKSLIKQSKKLLTLSFLINL